MQTLLDGEYDERAAVVTIRAGAGGVDAADFAEMLLRMYLRWAEQHEYPVDGHGHLLRRGGRASSRRPSRSTRPTRSARSRVEAGTHRLVRISPFDSAGKRQTTFAAVEVHPAHGGDRPTIEIPENDIRVDVFRSSGPGGQ